MLEMMKGADVTSEENEAENQTLLELEGMWGGRVGSEGKGEGPWKMWEVGQVKKVWSEGMEDDEGLVFKFLPVTSLQNNVNR